VNSLCRGFPNIWDFGDCIAGIAGIAVAGIVAGVVVVAGGGIVGIAGIAVAVPYCRLPWQGCSCPLCLGMLM
jgi:hypothetical protein